MSRAVCGFLFSDDGERVVLVRKNRPAWQAGLFNGAGGRVEEGEFALDAMVREFEEETGAAVRGWEPFCLQTDEMRTFQVTYYRAFGDVTACTTTTDEEVVVVRVDALSEMPVVHNLRWLVPMALDQTLREARVVWRRP